MGIETTLCALRRLVEREASAGSLLLLREAGRRLAVCRRLAAAMPDRRDRCVALGLMPSGP